MKWKILLTLTALLFCSSLALAQPSQEMPHRVFGTVEDTQGNAVTDTEVEAVFEGETLVSDITDEEGYYDLTIPNREDYSSEEVQIQVSGSQADSFIYNSGEVEEKDLTIESSQQQNNQEEQTSSGGGGGGGFGGGTLPEQENQDNETETNSTETENETIEDQDNSITEETTDKSDNDGDNEDTTNSSKDTNSTDSENSLTGMFSSSTSSIGEMFTGFLDTIVSTITSIFN